MKNKITALFLAALLGMLSTSCTDIDQESYSALLAQGYTNIKPQHRWGIWHCSKDDFYGHVYTATSVVGYRQELVVCGAIALKDTTVRVLKTYPGE